MKRKLFALLLALMLVCTLASCGLVVPRPEIREGTLCYYIAYRNGERVTGSLRENELTLESKRVHEE